MQRALDLLLAGIRWESCLVYLDDIITFGPTFKIFLDNLRKVLDLLREADLKLKPNKCFFGFDTVKYLGHQISPDGVGPDPDKIESVKKFPVPQNRTGVRSFLGLTGYYRRFIEDYAIIIKPLFVATSEKQPFIWTNDCREAFEKLKEVLITAPVLVMYDHEQELRLHTDASGIGLGVILHQGDPKKKTVLAYANRCLSPAETRYTTSEKEALAIVWGVERFRHYLFGRPFIVLTDHHALCWFRKFKNPANRLGRWMAKMEEYQYEIHYKKGKLHVDADCLSRMPVLPAPSDSGEDCSIYLIQGQYEMAEEQDKDANLQRIKQKILNKEEFPEKDKYQVVMHILYYACQASGRLRLRLVIPTHLHEEVLRLCHDIPSSGHIGFTKTYARIQADFYWPGMKKDIQTYVLSCHNCQINKKMNQKAAGLLEPIPTGEPAEKWGYDFIGPFPPSTFGCEYIIVCIDYATRFCVARAIKKARGPAIISFFKKEIIERFGRPKALISNQGSQQMSEVVQKFLEDHLIEHRATTAYHQQADGLAERINQTVMTMVRQQLEPKKNQRDWADKLPLSVFAYNTSKQSSLQETPFFLMHQFHPTLPVHQKMGKALDISTMPRPAMEDAEESRSTAKECLERAQERQKMHYDRRHAKVTYQGGDLVLLKDQAPTAGSNKKLKEQYRGPYEVLERVSDVNYKIAIKRRNKEVVEVVHVANLKRYLKRRDPPQEDNDGSIESNDQTEQHLGSNANPEPSTSEVTLSTSQQTKKRKRGRPKKQATEQKPLDGIPVLTTQKKGKTNRNFKRQQWAKRKKLLQNQSGPGEQLAENSVLICSPALDSRPVFNVVNQHEPFESESSTKKDDFLILHASDDEFEELWRKCLNPMMEPVSTRSDSNNHQLLKKHQGSK